MTEPDQPETRAQAGAAGASAAPTDAAATPAGPLEFSTERDDSVGEEFGVRFTSDYEPGGDYDVRPPPPAEDQHAMGLHSLAREHEQAALEAAGSRQAMQGDEGPHVNANTEEG